MMLNVLQVAGTAAEHGRRGTGKQRGGEGTKEEEETICRGEEKQNPGCAHLLTYQLIVICCV